MSTIAEFVVPSPAFILQTLVEAETDLTVDIVRMVTGNATEVTPYFWIVGGGFSTVDESLSEDPSVASYDLLEDNGDERLYRAEWADDEERTLLALTDVDATILEARSTGDDWEIKMLFSDYDTLSEFSDYTATYDLSFELSRLYQPSESEPNGHYGLTEEQTDALLTASELGYFDVPRNVTQSDVADTLGISDNACSARLRRGHETLIAHTIGDNDLGGDGLGDGNLGDKSPRGQQPR